jgi:hypothetical protein
MQDDSTSDSPWGRQPCALEALTGQADPGTVIRALPTIAAAVKKDLSTDIPIEALSAFIEILPKIDADQIISTRFVPNLFIGIRISGGYNTPDGAAIRDGVDVAPSLPPAEALAALGLDNTAAECG